MNSDLTAFEKRTCLGKIYEMCEPAAWTQDSPARPAMGIAGLYAKKLGLMLTSKQGVLYTVEFLPAPDCAERSP